MDKESGISTSMRNITQLTQEEKELIKTEVDALDYKKTTEILNLGYAQIEEICQMASRMIVEFELKIFESEQLLIDVLVKEIDKVDIKELLKKRRVSIIPGKKKNKILETLMKQTSLIKQLGELEEKIVLNKIFLIRDIELCKKTIKEMYVYAEKLELVYITVQEVLKKAQEEKETYKTKGAESSRINKVIEKLELKMKELKNLRNLILKSVKQIEKLKEKDEEMVPNLNNTIIKIWEWENTNFIEVLENYRINNEKDIKDMVGNKLQEYLNQTENKSEKVNFSIDLETTKKEYKNLRYSLKRLKEEANKNNDVRSLVRKTGQNILNLNSEEV